LRRPAGGGRRSLRRHRAAAEPRQAEGDREGRHLREGRALMASRQLDVVIAHMQAIAARAARSGGGHAPNPRLVDEYGDVHPSVRAADAEVRRLEVAGVPCEWLLAPGAHPDRRLLYLHGGGWTAGGLDSHRPLSARVSKASGCAVLAVDYRLAPE